MEKGCLKQGFPTGVEMGVQSGRWGSLLSTGRSAFPEGQPPWSSPRLRGGCGLPFSFSCGGKALSPPLGHRPSPSRAAPPALFVRPQESGHFGAQQFDEGPGEHLFGLLGCVLEVVLGVCQHVKEGLDQLLVLQGKGRLGEAKGWGAGG